LNTNIASVPEALTNQNRKTEAPEKIQAIAAKPKSAPARKNEKVPPVPAAVIAGGVEGGEAGLQILRQR
jgi:hypothetical protein